MAISSNSWGNAFGGKVFEDAFGPVRRGVKEGWCARERPCPSSPVEPVLAHLASLLAVVSVPVSYTHLTLPTILLV